MSTRLCDLVEKRRDCLQTGVRECRAVDLGEKAVRRHLLERGEYRVETCRSGHLASAVVDGFEIEADRRGQDPLPGERECLQRRLPSWGSQHRVHVRR